MIIPRSTLEGFLKARFKHTVIFQGMPDALVEQVSWCENRCRGYATNLRRMRNKDTINERQVDYQLEDTWDIWVDQEHQEVRFLFKEESDAALFKLFWNVV